MSHFADFFDVFLWEEGIAHFASPPGSALHIPCETFTAPFLFTTKECPASSQPVAMSIVKVNASRIFFYFDLFN